MRQTVLLSALLESKDLLKLALFLVFKTLSSACSGITTFADRTTFLESLRTTYLWLALFDATAVVPLLLEEKNGSKQVVDFELGEM